MNLQDYSENCNPQPFINTTGERIPPGAVLANNGSPDEFGRKRVGKPKANSQVGCYLNGPFSCEPTIGSEFASGWCTYHSPVLGAFDPDGGVVPQIGETWGPVAGSWYLAKGKAGFLIDGDPDMEAGLVPVVRVYAVDEEPYGSYPFGSGSSARFRVPTNLGCGPTGENQVYDLVEYTIIAFIRSGRINLSISAAVIQEDVISLPTKCEDVLADVSASAVCIDGAIAVNLGKTFKKVRVVDCGACP